MPSAAPAALISGFVLCLLWVLDNVVSWVEAEIMIKQSGPLIVIIHPFRAMSAVHEVIAMEVDGLPTSNPRAEGYWFKSEVLTNVLEPYGEG